MSNLNAFQVLAKKKLIGLAADLVMKDDKFAKELAFLLIDHGTPVTEIREILEEIKVNNVHNKIETKNRSYVYNRFSLFDKNLGRRLPRPNTIF